MIELSEIKEICLEEKEFLLLDDKGYYEDLFESNKSKTPDWYGICFISFKHNLIINIQDGSSVTSILYSKHLDHPEGLLKSLQSFNLYESKKIDKLLHLKYNPVWMVINNNQSKEHILKVKNLMEFCNIKFSEEEESLWLKYYNELD